MKDSIELLALLGVSEGLVLIITLMVGIGLVVWRLAKNDSRIVYLMKRQEENEKNSQKKTRRDGKK